MNLSRRCLFAAVAAFAASARIAAATDRLPGFRRGVSIHNVLNWAKADDARTGYQWPPFATPQHQLKSETLDNVRKAGFDFIRLTIDPGPFLFFDGARRDELDGQLLAQVQNLVGRGFGVVVDLHSNSQVAAYAPEKITETPDSPLFRSYLALVGRVARLLAPLAEKRVAFELMNEPQWGWDADSAKRWQGQLQRMYTEARTSAPKLKLVLTGARGGDIGGLVQVDPRPFDANTLWSFHYYEPYLLTHQGVRSDVGQARLWRYFSDLPYPAAPEFFDGARAVLRANVFADTTLSAREKERTFNDAERALREYLNGNPGRARVAADFGKLDAWTKQYDIPRDRLFMGEFGVTRTYGPYKASPPGPLKNWLADVRAEAEARNIGWALWALSGYGGMSLIEADDTSVLDKPTLSALGMNQ